MIAMTICCRSARSRTTGGAAILHVVRNQHNHTVTALLGNDTNLRDMLRKESIIIRVFDILSSPNVCWPNLKGPPHLRRKADLHERSTTIHLYTGLARS
jgi:hypothetical protein